MAQMSLFTSANAYVEIKNDSPTSADLNVCTCSLHLRLAKCAVCNKRNAISVCRRTAQHNKSTLDIDRPTPSSPDKIKVAQLPPACPQFTARCKNWLPKNSEGARTLACPWLRVSVFKKRFAETRARRRRLTRSRARTTTRICAYGKAASPPSSLPARSRALMLACARVCAPTRSLVGLVAWVPDCFSARVCGLHCYLCTRLCVCVHA